jgi:hypothetical protein
MVTVPEICDSLHWRLLPRPPALLLLLALAAPLRPSVELHLYHRALERLLAEQFFSQEGRLYVKGGKAARCNFAFLENPRIGGDNGRLRIQARFSGRSALNVFGACIGLGDSFELTIRATPAYQDGCLVLRGVEVASQGRSFYSRRVSKTLAASLQKDFRFAVAEQARRLLEPQRPGASYRQELSDLAVTAIRVTAEALVLTVSFRLTVK